jgi:hypothetical protein
VFPSPPLPIQRNRALPFRNRTIWQRQQQRPNINPWQRIFAIYPAVPTTIQVIWQKVAFFIHFRAPTVKYFKQNNDGKIAEILYKHYIKRQRCKNIYLRINVNDYKQKKLS